MKIQLPCSFSKIKNFKSLPQRPSSEDGSTHAKHSTEKAQFSREHPTLDLESENRGRRWANDGSITRETCVHHRCVCCVYVVTCDAVPVDLYTDSTRDAPNVKQASHVPRREGTEAQEGEARPV